jgi:hypothetical protein
LLHSAAHKVVCITTIVRRGGGGKRVITRNTPPFPRETTLDI